MAVALTFKGSDQGARATAEGIAKALDQLGVSADKVKFNFQDTKKGSEGLFGSLKDLRSETRQHERLFSFYGAKLAEVTGIAKGLGAEIAGLGIALGSGMMTLAGIEAAKIAIHAVTEELHLQEQRAKSLEKLHQTIADGIAASWGRISEKIEPATLGLKAFREESERLQPIVKAARDELEKYEAAGKGLAYWFNINDNYAEGLRARIAAVNQALESQKDLAQIMRDVVAGGYAETTQPDDAYWKLKAEDARKAREKERAETLAHNKAQDAATKERIERELQAERDEAEGRAAIRKKADEREAAAEAAKVKQSLFELKIESDEWERNYKRREQLSDHVSKAMTDDVLAIVQGQKSLGDVVKEVTLSIGRDLLGLAIKSIIMSALDAGGKAFASQAAIPVVGPALGAAAQASTISTILGLLGSLPSAASGARIPAGVNPIMQLHENERVLTAQETRAYERGGGVTFNVSTPDAAGVERMLSDSESAFNRWDRRRRRSYRGG